MRGEFATVWLVSGVALCLRPFPRVCTCAPVPRCTSWQRRLVSSVTRSPVWIASVSSAWSRRPIHRSRSGAARSASTSFGGEVGDDRAVEPFGRDRDHPAISAACSGWRRAAYRNIEWIAASLALRVLGLLARWYSRWSRNAAINGASRSSSSSLDGCLPVRSLREAEQQPEGVSVGGDRVWADAFLVDQPAGEERLERRCQRGHRRGPVERSRRSAASASNSGAADKYQNVAAGSTCPR